MQWKSNTSTVPYFYLYIMHYDVTVLTCLYSLTFDILSNME